MMGTSLPPLIPLDDFHGNWEQYVDKLYQIFLKEVVNAQLTFQGLPVHVRFQPMVDGKGFGFWHIISEGPKENKRTPDLRRCERLRWIPWMIKNVEHAELIRWWENRRGQEIHVVLWMPSEQFAVILAKRSGYYLIKTAYIVAPHRKKTFEKEWRAFWNLKG